MKKTQFKIILYYSSKKLIQIDDLSRNYCEELIQNKDQQNIFTWLKFELGLFL